MDGCAIPACRIERRVVMSKKSRTKKIDHVLKSDDESFSTIRFSRTELWALKHAVDDCIRGSNVGAEAEAFDDSGADLRSALEHLENYVVISEKVATVLQS
jgi:hypothetical protein